MNHFSSTVSTIVRQKRRSEGYLLVLLVHGFLVLRESRRSLSVEPVQVVTLCAKVTCTGMNGVEIMTRVPRRHGDRHGESKDTSTKISNNTSLSFPLDFSKIPPAREPSAPPSPVPFQLRATCSRGGSFRLHDQFLKRCLSHHCCPQTPGSTPNTT